MYESVSRETRLSEKYYEEVGVWMGHLHEEILIFQLYQRECEVGHRGQV